MSTPALSDFASRFAIAAGACIATGPEASQPLRVCQGAARAIWYKAVRTYVRRPCRKAVRARGQGGSMEASAVYFASMRVKTSDSVPNKLARLLRAAGIADLDCGGKLIGVKTHFGEYGNVTYLKPAYLRTIAAEVRTLGGTPFATDCNTLYPGKRSNAIDHLACAADNGFSYRSCGCDVVVADGLRGADEVVLPTREGSALAEARVGRTILEADATISLTHAKGCSSSSYGGVLKNLSMGCASRAGKMIMHSKGAPGIKGVCIGCGICIEACAQGAISVVDGKARISDACVGCGHCVAYCPRAAIGSGEPSWSDMQRNGSSM